MSQVGYYSGGTTLTEHDLKILAVFFNGAIIIAMVASGIWVGLDAYRNGRNRAEAIMWGLFAGWFLVVGPIFYVFFKKRFYKS